MDKMGDRCTNHRLPCFADCICNSDIHLETRGNTVGKPEWDMVSVWDRTQAAFAIVFWVTMLSLLLYHRCQAGKEIKMAESAPVEDKDDSVQP